MTTELRALRVSADMDSSKYVAGANQKVAADKAMVASSQGVAQSVTQQDQKISQAGDVLARLSRQYVDGYAAAQRFNSALNSLSRGIDQGKIAMAQAVPILDGIYAKYGLMGDAAQFAAKGQIELANAITRANAKLAEQRQIRPANSNLANFNATNAAYQVQDVAMMSMMGQSWMAVGLQQGPQLAMAIQQGGGVAALGAGIASLINPTMLLTVGLTAATAAAVQFFMSSEEGADKLGTALSAHKQAVLDVKRAYEEAATGARSLGEESLTALDVAERQSRRELQRQFRSGSTGINSRLNSFNLGTFLPSWLQLDDVTSVFAPFQSEIDKLRAGINAGRPDFVAFQESLQTTADTDPDRLRLWADVLSDIVREAAKAQKALEQLRHDGGALLGPRLGQRADEASRVYNPILLRMHPEATDQLFGPSASEREVERLRRQAQLEAELQQIRARSVEERIAAAAALEAARDIPGELESERIERLNTAATLERARAEKSLADAQRARAQSRADLIAGAEMELGLIGLPASQQAALRKEYELMEELKRESRETGRAIGEQEAAAVRETAKAYGELTDAITKRHLAEQLAFEQAQLFRSQEDQEIAGRLRGAGLPVDLQSVEAGQMRMIQQLERMKETWEEVFDTARDGIDGLVDALFEGGDIGEALKQIGRDFARLMFDLALTNPLKNWLTGSSLNTISDLGIFPGAASGRGGGFGGVLGNLFGAQHAVASMQVQAATVMVNGSVIGGGGLPGLGSLFGGVPTAANSNTISFGELIGAVAKPGSAANQNGPAAKFVQDIVQSRISSAFGDTLVSPLGGVDDIVTNAITGAVQKAVGSGNAAGFLMDFLGSGKAGSHITGMSEGLQSGLAAMLDAAPAGIRDAVTINSGFRSVARQQQLFDAAVAKYGSVAAARRWVAPPGNSQHNFGNAADLGFGSSAARDWFHDNAEDFGLRFPLKHEPWHIETMGARGGQDISAAFTQRLSTANRALDQFNGAVPTASSAVGGLSNVAANGLGNLATQAGTAAGGLGKVASVIQGLPFPAAPTGGGGLLGFFGSLFGGGLQLSQSALSPTALAAVMGGAGGLYANGAAFWGGNVIPFANGGVVDRPTFFPMAKGTGLMGEAGPEAVMPLRRDRSGRLGVAASGGGKGETKLKVINVFDPSVVGDYLRTDEGEQLVMNVLRRNDTGRRR